MTDREMLEFAAKAAGVDGYWIDRKRMVRDFVFIRECGLKTNLGIWNPIADDGDALRLAVLLGFTVDVDNDEHFTEVEFTSNYEDKSASEGHGFEPAEATRRAITRAAAQIGKEME